MSKLFLPFILLGLFNVNLSSNPDSVLVESSEDKVEKSPEIKIAEIRQKFPFTFDGYTRIVVRRLRPITIGSETYWWEVGTENFERVPDYTPPSRGFRPNPPNSRRQPTTERSITSTNSRTTVDDSRSPVTQSRNTDNINNHRKDLKTSSSPPIINPDFINDEGAFYDTEVLASDSPKRIPPDSNFFAGMVNDFAFKMVERSNFELNFVISPISIYVAMSMCYLGADGNTKAQMEEALGMDSKSAHDDNFHKGIHDLLSLVVEKTNGYELAVANGLFLGKNITPEDQFEKNIAKHYNVEPTKLDFGNPELSLQFINQWVSDNTNNMIPKIIDRPLSTQTRLLLLNAVFFKGIWKKQFPIHLSFNGKFHALDQTHNNVRFMTMFDETFPMYRSEELKHTFLKLPYQGDEVSMIIALPFARESPMPRTTDEDLCRVRDLMVDTKLDTVTIPKFQLTFKIPLKGPLQKAGISDIFHANVVNFKRLRRENDVVVSAVMHKAVIEIDEIGSVASASSGVGYGPLIFKNNTKFVADHPFAFYIMHEPTGLVLFYGKIFEVSSEPIISNNQKENMRLRPRPVGSEPVTSNNQRENMRDRVRPNYQNRG